MLAEPIGQQDGRAVEGRTLAPEGHRAVEDLRDRLSSMPASQRSEQFSTDPTSQLRSRYTGHGIRSGRSRFL